MNVLINALALRAGGGQTYLYNLLQELPNDRQHTVFLVAPVSFRAPSHVEHLKRLHPVGLKWIEYPGLRLLWELLVLPTLLWRLKIDTVFIPGGVWTGKRTSKRNVVTACQNMMPFDHALRAKYPIGYMRLRTHLLEPAFLRSFAASDLVIFISHFAKERVLGLLGADRVPKRIIVESPGVNPAFIKHHEQQVKRPEWLPAKYVLYVSTIDIYKAQLEVVRGFASFLNKNPASKLSLVLVGSEYKPYADLVRNEVLRLKIEDRVVFQGLVAYSKLPAVYQNAEVNVFASECENCPNILLEAMASGRPLLVSNRPPMPEFAGDAVTYFNPSDSEDFATKLSDMVARLDEVEKNEKKMIAQVLQFDGAKSSRIIWENILALPRKRSEV